MQDVNVVLRVDLAKTIDVNFSVLVPPENSSLSTIIKIKYVFKLGKLLCVLYYFIT